MQEQPTLLDLPLQIEVEEIQEPKPVEYRDIPGFPGYRAGTDGSIWSCRGSGKLDTSKWRILSQLNSKTPYKLTVNYRFVQLRKDGRYHVEYVHRLVLEAFVGPCPAGMQACHDNGVRSDCRLENLRWDTPKNNHADRLIHGTDSRGEKSVNAKLTEAQVREIIRRRILGEKINKIALEYKVSRTLISQIIKRQKWKHVV